MHIQKIIRQLEKLIDIGIALSSEKDTSRLLEKILLGAKSITDADGGTLFLKHGDVVIMEIFQSDRLGIFFNDCANDFMDKPSVPLYLKNSEPNLHNVVSYSYHNDKTVNIHDAYDTVHFDFSGTKEFDQKNHYHSQSFLAIPLKDHQGETLGVLQLINAIDPLTKEIIDFDPVSQRFVEALASQAATVLTKQELITDLEDMFESMIKLIATAIDEKSPYTGKHCRRVPELTMMLAEAAHNTDTGYLRDFQLNDADRYELTVAGWLHGWCPTLRLAMMQRPIRDAPIQAMTCKDSRPTRQQIRPLQQRLWLLLCCAAAAAAAAAPAAAATHVPSHLAYPRTRPALTTLQTLSPTHLDGQRLAVLCECEHPRQHKSGVGGEYKVAAPMGRLQEQQARTGRQGAGKTAGSKAHQAAGG